MIPADGALVGSRLTDAISAAMVELYAEFYEHARTTATTYINDNIVVCVLENILSADGTAQIGDGRGSDVIDGRVAFQEGAEDEFTGAIERLMHRSVTAFSAPIRPRRASPVSCSSSRRHRSRAPSATTRAAARMPCRRHFSRCGGAGRSMTAERGRFGAG